MAARLKERYATEVTPALTKELGIKNPMALPRLEKIVLNMERGDLVPDATMIALVHERLAAPDARGGFILDGFPRTVAQAEALEQELPGNGNGISAVINLLVPDAVLIERLRGRSGTEGRADDRPDAVAERLKIYQEKTAPLVEFFRQKRLLAEVPGVGGVSEVAERIDRALEAPRSQGAA